MLIITYLPIRLFSSIKLLIKLIRLLLKREREDVEVEEEEADPKVPALVQICRVALIYKNKNE